ncbi:MAG: hypothetical protein N0C84_05760 [Candidatus Thiodiazotropha taylori]|uniref:Uncharacterized protein n=1 Tax=Candidatus Thiodiazotropha taylori TaxID=2792791 RepID=A0A9E4KBJ6_9GAMM|nr:hypothetical protein [Candidatus Thiodiazotropha taylori]MCW4255959.1 hypothetical protein [Candidatus Thiodiazotropha taylori]
MKRIVNWLFGFKKITASRLRLYGFTHNDLGDCPPYDTYEKCGIVVWDWNGKYWLVDALDQACIDREFRYMADLALFFKACDLDMYS